MDYKIGDKFTWKFSGHTHEITRGNPDGYYELKDLQSIARVRTTLYTKKELDQAIEFGILIPAPTGRNVVK